MHLGHVNVNIFASKSVPFRPTMVQMPNSTSWEESDYNVEQKTRVFCQIDVKEFHLKNLGRVWNMGYG